MQIRRKWSRLVQPAALLIVLLVVGCSENEPSVREAEPASQPSPSSFETLNPALNQAAKEIALDYVEQIATDFQQARSALEQMQTAVHDFVDAPSAANMAAARRAWLEAHSAYELTTLHRYFAAQVLDDALGLELLRLQYRINHWPIIPGYIDYVEGYPDSGIVHDINVALSREALVQQHGIFDVAEVTLGFHVIEFLLWGYAAEPAGRPASDYEPVAELSQDEAENGYLLEQLSNNRRRQLLTVITESLLDDFIALQALWLEQRAPVRQDIESLAAADAIVLLADSMAAMLTEELLLRSLYPMLNGDFDQSIQSPYSLSTQNAVSTQLSGLERLLLERQTQDGTTLDLVFSAVSDDFSEFFYQNFDASKSCLVLLYSSLDSEIAEASSQREIEIVECINLLTNMVDHIERLKFELLN